MILSKNFKWLGYEPSTKMVTYALAAYGVKEDLSEEDNPIIMGWAQEVNEVVPIEYYKDETAWCGLFMAVVAKRAGKQVVKDPLWALNWRNFGIKAKEAMLGDVLVFNRFNDIGEKIGGHVGLYVGENDKFYFVLGGNQDEAVCIKAMTKENIVAIRRPHYNNQPNAVRQIILDIEVDIAGKLV